MSYVIRNCPIFETDYYCGEELDKCATCTDCVMKRIVDYCLDNEKYGDEYYTNPILKLLDIQEVE